MPDAASSSQIRPPCASTIAREIARPSPAPLLGRAASAPPRKNGSKTRSRSAPAIPAPVSATSISTASPAGSARTTTEPSAGVWRIAFWIRLNRTRWSFSGSPRAGRSPGGSSARTCTCRASACTCIASTVSPTSSSSGTCSRLQAISPASRRDSSKRSSISPDIASRCVLICAEVGAPGLLVDDVVGDRVGQQPQRRDRRAQVVRDGGDELAPHPLGVVHHAAAHQLDRAQRDDDREHGDHADHERVVRRDEHERDPHGDRDDELADPDRDPQRELPPRRAEPAPAGAGDVGQDERGRAERRQQRGGQQPVAQAVDGGDHGAGRQRRAQPEERRPARAHGWNR